MSIFHPHPVTCVCTHTFTALLADCLNVRRTPEVRQQILRGELHRATCPSCGRQMTVEKMFYYLDLDLNALFKIRPRNERHLWKQSSLELDAASSVIPEPVSLNALRLLRVIFGMDELREKLVAQEAQLDDRLLELLKVLLVYEHPILLRSPRLRLVLEEVTQTSLIFMAAYEHAERRFQLQMPRAIADE